MRTYDKGDAEVFKIDTIVKISNNILQTSSFGKWAVKSDGIEIKGTKTKANETLTLNQYTLKLTINKYNPKKKKLDWLFDSNCKKIKKKIIDSELMVAPSMKNDGEKKLDPKLFED
jgi:hypothetical protein